MWHGRWQSTKPVKPADKDLPCQNQLTSKQVQPPDSSTYWEFFCQLHDFPGKLKKGAVFQIKFTQMVPFVMDFTNHSAPTHYWGKLGQPFACIIALNTLLGTSYWKALIIHPCLPWQRGACRAPRGPHLFQQIRYCSKMTHNNCASFQMSSHDRLVCHEPTLACNCIQSLI